MAWLPRRAIPVQGPLAHRQPLTVLGLPTATSPPCVPASPGLARRAFPQPPALTATPSLPEPELKSPPLRLRIAGANEHRPAERKKRLRSLQAQVAQARTEADVDALAGRAKRARRQAVENHPVTHQTEFGWEFIAQEDSFQLLGQTQLRLAHAAAAWENAADHADAAQQAALKLKLSAPTQAWAHPPGLRASDQVLHLDIKHQVVDGLRTLRTLRERWNPYKNCHHPHLYDRPASLLREVLAHCRLHATQLTQHPIHDFDAELQGMEAAMQRDRLHTPKSRWPAIVEDESHLSAQALAQSQARKEAFDASVETARSELVSVVRQLQAALHGDPLALQEVAQGLQQLQLTDLHADSASASSCDESPSVDELDLDELDLDRVPQAASESASDALELSHPQRVAELQEVIHLLIADAEHLGTQVLTSREAAVAGPPWKRRADEATAWHRTIQAYEHGANQLNRQSAAVFGKKATDPAVHELRDRIHVALQAAKVQMGAAVEATLEDFSLLFHDTMMGALKAGDNAAAMAMIDELDTHCRTVQAQLGAGSLPAQRLRALGVNPDQYQRPYAALTSLCAVLQHSRYNQTEAAFEHAALVQEAAGILDKAAKGVSNSTLAERLINLRETSLLLRLDLVQTACTLESGESHDCVMKLMNAIPQALGRVRGQCEQLPLLALADPLSDESLSSGGQATVSAAGSSKKMKELTGGSGQTQARQFSAELNAAVAEVNTLSQRTGALPPDTPDEYLATRRASLDTLSRLVTVASTAAGLVNCLDEAACTLERALPVRRPKAAGHFAVKLKNLANQADQWLQSFAKQAKNGDLSDVNGSSRVLDDDMLFLKEISLSSSLVLQSLKTIFAQQNHARDIVLATRGKRTGKLNAFDDLNATYERCAHDLTENLRAQLVGVQLQEEEDSLAYLAGGLNLQMSTDLYCRADYEQKIVDAKLAIDSAGLYLESQLSNEDLMSLIVLLSAKNQVLSELDKNVLRHVGKGESRRRFVPLFRASVESQKKLCELKEALEAKIVYNKSKVTLEKKITSQEKLIKWLRDGLNDKNIKNPEASAAILRKQIDDMQKEAVDLREQLRQLSEGARVSGQAKH